MIMAGVKQVVWLQDDPLIKVSMLKVVAEKDGGCACLIASVGWSSHAPTMRRRQVLAHTWVLCTRAFRECARHVQCWH